MLRGTLLMLAAGASVSASSSSVDMNAAGEVANTQPLLASERSATGSSQGSFVEVESHHHTHNNVVRRAGHGGV